MAEESAGLIAELRAAAQAEYANDNGVVLGAGVTMTEAADEIERLREQVLDLHETVFYSIATKDEAGKFAGWWDSMARTDARDAGDALVEAGRFERHADGFGKRQFYRPLDSHAGDEEA